MKKVIATMMATVIMISSMAFTTYASDKISVRDITGIYYDQLVEKGIINETNDKQASTENEKARIKNVQALGKDVLLVTLDSYFPSFNINDIKLQAYNSDWYSLKPVLSNRITYDNYAITKNSNGETVIVYKINQEIDNNRLIDDYGTQATLTDSKKAAAVILADNLISWQLDNGGWDKDYELHSSRPWNGSETKITHGWTALDGSPCGTIDNDATYTHMEKIAIAYAQTGEEKYKKSFEKGMDFLDLLQYESGGFAQVYPKRGNYSDYVTLNDDAMANVLIMLEKIKEKRYPYNTGVISEENYKRTCTMIDGAIDYLLKAQITSNGELSAWCAQHDPITYEPKPARAYEMISISGSESIGAIKFLMHQKDNEKAVKAAEAAIKWFDKNRLENTKFDNSKAPYFIESAGSTIWYRFYEIGTNKGLFGDRDGKVYYDISKISEERRTGYSWASTWPAKIISTYNNYGYYPNKIVVKVNGTSSTDINGKTLGGDNVSPTENNLSMSIGIKGDIDNDGKITARDSALLKEYIYNNNEKLKDEKFKKVADFNKSGSIDNNDCIDILVFVLNEK